MNEDDLAKALALAGATDPYIVCWKDLDPESTAAELERLTHWVNWAVHRYRLDHETIPPCWPDHGALVEELSALRTYWESSYQEDANPHRPPSVSPRPNPYPPPPPRLVLPPRLHPHHAPPRTPQLTAAAQRCECLRVVARSGNAGDGELAFTSHCVHWCRRQVETMESGLVRFDTGDGDGIVVEIAEDDVGFLRAASADGTVARAAATFDGALRDVARAAESALRTFRDGSLKPNEVELEFGIKLNAEVGAVIAKSALEGHLTVKLTWSATADGTTG